ncbi:MAG: hypothetical protein ABSF55_00985 [Candidatus Staskawiczbacteria bacterium]
MQEEIGEPKLNTGPEFESQESKIETGLPAEAVKAIMGKVQDINADGTAFSVLKGVFDSEPQNLGKVLESGLLGNPYQKRAKSVDRADWAKNVKEKKDAVVYFNILGRAEEQNLADTHYIGDPEGICVIFDTGSFAEQGKEDWENGRPIQKNRTLNFFPFDIFFIFYGL